MRIPENTKIRILVDSKEQIPTNNYGPVIDVESNEGVKKFLAFISSSDHADCTFEQLEFQGDVSFTLDSDSDDNIRNLLEVADLISIDVSAITNTTDVINSTKYMHEFEDPFGSRFLVYVDRGSVNNMNNGSKPCQVTLDDKNYTRIVADIFSMRKALHDTGIELLKNINITVTL